MIRPVKRSEVAIIEEFHRKFSTHVLDFDRILFHGVSENEGIIDVYGAVKEFNEIVISVNKDVPLKRQVAGIEQLLVVCKELAAQKGRNKLFAFADTPFSSILQSHYGFVELPERVLALKVNDGS